MAKEDILLRVEMGKLEIEPTNKLNKNIKFLSSLPQSKKCNVVKNIQSYKCACISQKKHKNISICKKKHKILREPILRLPPLYNKNDYHSVSRDPFPSPLVNQVPISESVSLHALVDNCNQLSISTDNNRRSTTSAQSNDEWWKSTVSNDKRSKEVYSDKGQTSSCSQQALNPPCDVTIDELASYFETLVHIPKKMSSMAEMMYI